MIVIMMVIPTSFWNCSGSSLSLTPTETLKYSREPLILGNRETHFRDYYYNQSFLDKVSVQIIKIQTACIYNQPLQRSFVT